jgi:2-polyprenyl-3-methyl-5-hydroxy-6-metoxy-1,4-benzoquinol methylase
MDQPGLDRREHERALTALGRINVVSRTVPSVWPLIREVAGATPGRPLRILDIACGGGQLTVALARRMEREGITGEVLGCDLSPVAVEYATTLAARAGLKHVHFAPLDVLNDPWPQGFDVVHCSLFLHHLADSDVVVVLRKMAQAAGRLVVVSDLRRTGLGAVLAWAGCHMLTRSTVVHVDGARSVAAAFTSDEALALAHTAGLRTATIHHTWPQRFVLTWTRPAA